MPGKAAEHFSQGIPDGARSRGRTRWVLAASIQAGGRTARPGTFDCHFALMVYSTQEAAGSSGTPPFRAPGMGRAIAGHAGSAAPPEASVAGSHGLRRGPATDAQTLIARLDNYA